MNVRRRSVLAGALSLPVVGCTDRLHSFDGGWVGDAVDLGHRLRDRTKAGATGRGDGPAPSAWRRARVVVIGAGVSGLACARALRRHGIDDVQLFDLEAVAGGNSRGHVMGGMRCPLGAHYVPTPAAPAVEVIELFESFGLSRRSAGRTVWDERQLCFSPQERLFIEGHWHEGLLPPVDALPVAQREPTLAQYRRFASVVDQTSARLSFVIPTARSTWTAEHDALDAVTFAQWLIANRFDAPALRWYLDYCCRDDYGAGAARVSAWAGLHYFASRHGFRAPGEDADSRRSDTDRDRDGILTWPEGNAHLAQRLAAPLGDALHAGRIALRVDEGRHAVDVDVMDPADGRIERWTAAQVVLAVPLFIAARLMTTRPAALDAVVARMPHAPWLVANLQVDAPLSDDPGAPMSWDNVIYRSEALGYVDAMHQSLRSAPGPSVLTSYWALGGDDERALRDHREQLLTLPWSTWSQRVMRDLTAAHPDLPSKTSRIDLMRYGHAMSIPAPGLRSSAALRALASPTGRISFAHTDLSAYSIFEEALHHGQRAADRIAAADRGHG